jgi:hypothetical protein
VNWGVTLTGTGEPPGSGGWAGSVGGASSSVVGVVCRVVVVFFSVVLVFCSSVVVVVDRLVLVVVGAWVVVVLCVVLVVDSVVVEWGWVDGVVVVERGLVVVVGAQVVVVVDLGGGLHSSQALPVSQLTSTITLTWPWAPQWEPQDRTPPALAGEAPIATTAIGRPTRAHSFFKRMDTSFLLLSG